MPTATLTSKGQLTVPKPVRDRLRVKPGDRIDFVLDADGGVRIRTASVDVRALKGILHRPGRKPVSLEEMDAAIRRGASRK